MEVLVLVLDLIVPALVLVVMVVHQILQVMQTVVPMIMGPTTVLANLKMKALQKPMQPWQIVMLLRIHDSNNSTMISGILSSVKHILLLYFNQSVSVASGQYRTWRRLHAVK